MTKPEHFGTDGLRGIANAGMLSPERVLALGRALGRLANEGGRRVAMASDPRRSSPMIAASLAAGIASEGADVLDLGVLPTPGLAALLPLFDAGLGVMVSASHNPMRDNGIKVLRGDAAKLEDAEELWLEREMGRAPADPPPTGEEVGRIDLVEDAVESYLGHLGSHFESLDLKGMKIVVDAANGATAAAGPLVFEQLGAEVVPLFAEPDGININKDCGAVHPESMAAAVESNHADLGVAFDGDGDRLMMAGRDGSIQDGDRLLYVCARHLKDQGRLAGDVVVGTVMTNFGLELAFRELGIRLERTDVGDRHIAARLRQNGGALGGEPSGHIIFGGDNQFIGDGIYSALAALSVVRASGEDLQALSSGMKFVPQVLLNVPVRAKPRLDTLAAVTSRIEAGERDLQGTGRVLVRYSGTENLLRVMTEGTDGGLVDRVANDIAAVVRDELGA